MEKREKTPTKKKPDVKKKKKKSVEKPTDNQQDKDEKGQFTKDNKLGNRFSAENQPEYNPGRPKTRALTDALFKHLKENAKKFPFTNKAAIDMKMDPKKTTIFEILMATLLKQAMQGKGDLVREMWARMEGQVPKHVTLIADDPVMEYLDFMRQQTEPSPPNDKPVKKPRQKIKRVRMVKHGGNGKP